MYKHIIIITILGLLISCESKTVIAPYTYASNPIYTIGNAEFFGNYYANDSILGSVFSVTLLTNGLTQTNGIIKGTGQKLYLENVFANPTDTILPAGTYTASSKGSSFSFYPGSTTIIDNQFYSLGAQIEYKEYNSYRNKNKLIVKGSFTVSYTNKLTTLNCNFVTNDSSKITGSYTGIMTYINRSH